MEESRWTSGIKSVDWGQGRHPQGREDYHVCSEQWKRLYPLGCRNEFVPIKDREWRPTLDVSNLNIPVLSSTVTILKGPLSLPGAEWASYSLGNWYKWTPEHSPGMGYWELPSPEMALGTRQRLQVEPFYRQLKGIINTLYWNMERGLSH